MSEHVTTSVPQVGTVVANDVVYVTTAYDLPPAPDASHLITEDDAPVDNLLSEKQQRLLTEPLYSSWLSEQPFLVAANVGLFVVPRNPAIVPDVMLSLDVPVPEDWSAMRSYLVWEFGKVPDVVIEIVSNKKGEEQGTKRQTYAQAGVPYYVIYDPLRQLEGDILEVYELRARRYEQLPDTWFSDIGLGVTLWEGTFEGQHSTWLRWCDQDRVVIPTGAERAESERQRAERLATKLRELGIDLERL
jgi:Uma2 family endonuclease